MLESASVHTDAVFYGYESIRDRGKGVESYECDSCSLSDKDCNNCSNIENKLSEYRRKYVY